MPPPTDTTAPPAPLDFDESVYTMRVYLQRRLAARGIPSEQHTPARIAAELGSLAHENKIPLPAVQPAIDNLQRELEGFAGNKTWQPQPANVGAGGYIAGQYGAGGGQLVAGLGRAFGGGSSPGEEPGWADTLSKDIGTFQQVNEPAQGRLTRGLGLGAQAAGGMAVALPAVVGATAAAPAEAAGAAGLGAMAVQQGLSGYGNTRAELREQGASPLAATTAGLATGGLQAGLTYALPGGAGKVAGELGSAEMGGAVSRLINQGSSSMVRQLLASAGEQGVSSGLQQLGSDLIVDMTPGVEGFSAKQTVGHVLTAAGEGVLVGGALHVGGEGLALARRGAQALDRGASGIVNDMFPAPRPAPPTMDQGRLAAVHQSLADTQARMDATPQLPRMNLDDYLAQTEPRPAPRELPPLEQPRVEPLVTDIPEPPPTSPAATRPNVLARARQEFPNAKPAELIRAANQLEAGRPMAEIRAELEPKLAPAAEPTATPEMHPATSSVVEALDSGEPVNIAMLAPRRAEGSGYLTTHIGVSVVLSGKEDEGLAKIAPTIGAYYGLMQELGFHVGETEVSPQPFMRPAFENKSAEAMEKMVEIIRDGLEEVAKK